MINSRLQQHTIKIGGIVGVMTLSAPDKLFSKRTDAQPRHHCSVGAISSTKT